MQSSKRFYSAPLPTRLALVVLLAVLLVVVVCHGMASILTRTAPEQAAKLWPSNARALAIKSTIVFGDGRTLEARREAAALARRALLRDPTSASAAATLGLHAEIDRAADATAFFRYAERLSRRDLRTQLWLIEAAVGRGDVKTALRHYDIALRVTPGAAGILHPVLASAIADPTIRVAMIDIFRQNPNWAPSFLNGVTINGPDFTAAARLLIEMSGAGIAVPKSAADNVVGSLVARGDFRLAWHMYALAHPAAERTTIRNGQFAVPGRSALPFDWTLPEDSGATATILGERGLEVEAPPAVGGVVARQLQYLPAGTYRLLTRAANVPLPLESRPYWHIACANGLSIARLPIAPSGEAPTTATHSFNVPADCAAQWLTLVVAPSDTPEGVTFLVQEVRLSQ